mgnify:CR=1 FL=1
MLGTFVLGILVIGIVIVFFFLAFDMNTKNEQEKIESSGDKYHFSLAPGFYPSGCDVYLNDILLYSGRTEKDTTLAADNVGKRAHMCSG